MYYSACGKCKECKDNNITDCWDSVYGKTGTYKYTIPKLLGGGGGGSTTTIDNTRKYTKDIFGNEHPTHIGYIKGYPDGSVRPEGDITRAEAMTVINKLLGRKPLESHVKSLKFNPYNDLLSDKWYYVTVLEATITHNYWLEDKEGYEYKWEDWK